MLRLDDTGFGGIKIWQEPAAFCYGVDAVLLADFAARGIEKKKQKRIMDLGTGTGIVPLILSHKTEANYLAGLEIQEASYNLARRNAEENELTDRLHFFHGDVAEFDKPALYGTLDAVTSNPPYTEGSCGIESGNPAKAIARHEISASLDDFIALAARLLSDRGDFYLVHRPSRLVDICESCRRHRLEPKEMRFVSGRAMEKPNILLVHCVKNGNRQLKILEPLAVRGENGEYSPEIMEIYERNPKTDQ